MRRPIPQGKKRNSGSRQPPEWYHLQNFRVLFSERERYGHRGVSGFDLAECPATDSILDFAIEFADARSGRDNRDADDLAARGNRELERHLAFQARFFLQVLIVDMA